MVGLPRALERPTRRRRFVLRPRRHRASLRHVCVVALVTVPVALASAAAAGAQATGSADAATLRAEADELASRYFVALSEYKSLDSQIADVTAAVADAEARATRARDAARARAVYTYKHAGRGLRALITSSDLGEAQRRAVLIDRVNATDNATYDALHRAAVQLRQRHRDLDQVQTERATALQVLRDQGAAIDAKLAAAVAAEHTPAAAVSTVSTGASATSATSAPPTNAPTTTTSANTTTTTTKTGSTTTTTAPPTPPSPPYDGTPGVNPHHDDPFLSCVRQRESGGNYSIVNPAGPYLGAYQFLQSTWNATANHAGRTNLIGVPANIATPYDQDDMAWALYQWQGAGPWGGGCP